MLGSRVSTLAKPKHSLKRPNRFANTPMAAVTAPKTAITSAILQGSRSCSWPSPADGVVLPSMSGWLLGLVEGCFALHAQKTQ